VGEARTDRPSPDLDRLTVAQAADALSISQDAVRKRIARGTIPHDRDESGRVFVYLKPSETVHKTDQDTAQDVASKTVQDTYIRSLEDQIAFLRRELERKDTILLNLTERIPQLEASSEARESPQTVEEPERAGAPPDTGSAEEATERPAATPVEGLPRWEWVLGVALSIASYPTALLLQSYIFFSTNSAPSPPLNPYSLVVWLPMLLLVVPGVFGYRVGRRLRNLRFWHHIAPTAALLIFFGLIVWFAT
jgi:uncharacterized coiled-coil protein SlyX